MQLNPGKLRNLETAISESNVLAAVELFLRTTSKTLYDNHDVISIEMGAKRADGAFPLKIIYREEQVAQSTQHG